MKLKSIRIIGMHNVVDKTYDINSIITYFRGPNGAGKSTVLEAIQLVILGYIPGYNKTNEAIMKHSPTSEMQVIGTFDDGTTIMRKWTRSGSSISSSVSTIPSMDKVELVDSQLELPIYNFSEFKDMTANKLKEWFISFLPSVSDSINWEDRLIKSIGDRSTILRDNLLSSVLNQVNVLSGTYQGLELIQNLNTYLKTEQSFTKKEIERLESTIQSLVHYDEDDLPGSKESVQNRISEYMNMLTQLSEYESKLAHIDAVNRKLVALDKVDLTTSATDIEEVESYVEARNAVTNIQSEFDRAVAEKDDIDAKIDNLRREFDELSRIKDSTCPYTLAKCVAIQELVDENKLKLGQLQLSIDKYVEDKDAAYAKMKEINNKLFVAKTNLEIIASQYNTFFQLKSVSGDPSSIVKPTELTRDEISANIQKLQESLSKIQANEKYNELIETITKDKFNATNDLEILKIWVKLTDANGLQTEMMSKPFENLAEDMNSYLSKMFGEETTAQFNLSSKANSFSFGLVRDNKYIEFDYLSSGERCLFTLALMICILNRSNTNLRTILIDDLIDHLDDDNAENVFKSIRRIDDIQFILAGVKCCEGEGVIDVQM